MSFDGISLYFQVLLSYFIWPHDTIIGVNCLSFRCFVLLYFFWLIMSFFLASSYFEPLAIKKNNFMRPCSM